MMGSERSVDTEWARRLLRRAVPVILLLAVAAIGAHGQSTVVYTEGFPLVSTGDGWRELYIGDTVGSDATVKLGAGEYLELETPRGVLRFDRPGSYQLEELAGGSRENDARSTVFSLIGGKLNTAVKGSDYRGPSGAAGVRGAEAEGAEELFFMESESLDLIRRGRQLLADTPDREHLATAARYFEEARLYAVEPAEENEALFYLGYVALREGQPGEAMQHLSAADPVPEAPYYGSYLMLSGRIYLMNGRPEQAVELLRGAADERLSAGEQESLKLLLGTALIEAGRPAEARQPLKAVLDGGPAEETRQAAELLLESIES